MADTPLTQLPPGLDPSTNMVMNGKLYTKGSSSKNRDAFAYMGPASGFQSLEDAQAADIAESGNSWVPATTKEGMPLWMKAFVATGLASAGITAGAALAGVGGAGAVAPAAAQAAASAPEAAGAAGLATGVGGVSALPAAGTTLPLALPSAMTAPAVSGLGATSTGLGTLSKVGTALKGAGAAIGAASGAEANNRSAENDAAMRVAELELQNNQLGLSAYNANAGVDQSAFNANEQGRQSIENELMNRATLEGSQREMDLRHLYKDSTAQNPARSPFDPKGAPALSEAYKRALADLATQGGAELSQAPQYSVSKMPRPTFTPYVPPKPYVLPSFTPPVLSKGGAMSKVGNWLGPLLTGASGLF